VNPIKPTTPNTNPQMQMARTTRETVHGNPGERRVLPANILIVVTCSYAATNHGDCCFL
jgi:hypothetical protein